MFVGVTACVKTEFLLRLLETEYKNHFEFFVILCRTILDNKTYLSRKWILDDKNLFIACGVEGKLNEWIKLFKNTLNRHQTLFIIHDCSAESEINKKPDALSELGFSSQHRNHSLWVLTQKYNSLYKDVREQIKWLCLFFTKDRDSVEDCLRENDVIPDKNERNKLNQSVAWYACEAALRKERYAYVEGEICICIYIYIHMDGKNGGVSVEYVSLMVSCYWIKVFITA